MTSLVNRALGRMFPEHFGSGVKHNHYRDFGYPETLQFEDFKRMYDRNGFGTAAVDRTVLKCWEEVPQLWLTADGGESDVENAILEHFQRIRVWQKLATADARSLVGGYAGLVLRVTDGKAMDEPVESVSGGLVGLVEVIPAWASQLTVVEWVEDQSSDDYGKPAMFQFAEVSNHNKSSIARNIRVHPDRVIVWSDDGTLDCESILKSGFNNLIDLEKISGAGGEGFWKNAKSAPVLEVDKDADFKKMASSMGVKPEEIKEKMSDQVENYQRGLDNILMLQGISAKPLPITLSSPQHFFLTSLQMFSASVCIPMKIVAGNQNGERASTEDSTEWAKTCKSRRSMVIMPLIREFISRMVRFGILTDQKWHVEWSDLTDSSTEQKMKTAATMSDINHKASSTGEIVFLSSEIRVASGHKAEADGSLDIEEEDDDDAE